jgi:ferric-dicitrate binding protein FerR (iron transport regulator)
MTHTRSTDFEAANWWLELRDADFGAETWEAFEKWLFSSRENLAAYQRVSRVVELIPFIVRTRSQD